MALTKVTSNGITDSSVTTAKIATGGVATADIADDAVTSAKINNGVVSADDLASSLDLSGKTVTLPASATAVVDQNIALLGFKMAVNEGLTVFNLVDGVVDEFHDESGTDEGEGSNDLYNSSCDFYINSTQPTGTASVFTAGFALTTVTEADTSTAPANPAQGTITAGAYTVPTGITSVEVFQVGGGGGGSATPGGNGGYTKGALAVTAGQTLHVHIAEEGQGPSEASEAYIGGGGGRGAHPGYGAPGGGATVLATAGGSTQGGYGLSAPQLYLVAGGGGGGADGSSQSHGGGDIGGVTGASGGPNESPTGQTSANGQQGGGGDQEQGGQAASSPTHPGAENGAFLRGGDAHPSGGSGGGGGYYGGGSSYIGHPQITSGDTISASAPDGVSNFWETENTAQPAGAQDQLAPLTTPTPHGGYSGNGGVGSPSGSPQAGGEGYTFIFGDLPATATSTTVVSNAFTASSAPSESRIVVFQENIATPTLNTDIIASISRDGGTTFTTATLTDSGYVTGSSGQRILTGTATVSGQPSGTSMRWKLALANNSVKIHGVSLQWK